MKNSRWEEGKRRQFKPDPNSTKNEWRFRLANPSEFNEDSFLSRRSTVAGIRYVIGKKKGSDEYVVQSIRMNKKKVSWTKAKKWWKENEDKFHFSNDHDSITPSKEKQVRHEEYKKEGTDPSSKNESEIEKKFLESELPDKKEYKITWKIIESEKEDGRQLYDVHIFVDGTLVVELRNIPGKKEAIERAREGWLTMERHYEEIRKL